ncbi:MAG: Rho termination factor N-terminal domain-containing protein [Sellimonas intestinalis]|uniref:SAP domain-containing protein n=1 Tax=Sellimonas intestinalis TaxID=1653434 RepID=UPI0039A11586
MRTVGLTFHEDTQAAPAVEAGASLPEAGTAAPEAGAQTPAPAPEKALEDMTVTELRSFAAAHGIDVTGAAKKQDLLLAVQTAVEPSAAPAEAVPGEQPEMVAE